MVAPRIWQSADPTAGADWQPTSLKAKNEALAQKRVDDMMSKSITVTHPESLFRTNSNGGVISREEKIEMTREARRQKKNTLTQWFGMKRVKATPDVQRELELLKYRSLVTSERTGAPKNIGKGSSLTPEFFEMGFFVGTGKNKKRRTKSFADEWLESDPVLGERIQQVALREARRRRKQAAKNYQDLCAAGKKQKTDRSKNNDDDLDDDIPPHPSDDDNDAGNSTRRPAAKASSAAAGSFGRRTKRQEAKLSRRAAR